MPASSLASAGGNAQSLPPPLPSTVCAADVDAAVARYPAAVPPSLLEGGLDAFRYEELPALVAGRLQEAGESDGTSEDKDVVLTEAELLRLVDWKLRHGTYRPALRAQVAGNGRELVERTVGEAVRDLRRQLDELEGGDGGDDDKERDDEAAKRAVLRALGALTRPLRGVGPATASLVLAVCFPHRVPFFGDELWRWSVVAEAQPASKRGGGGGGKQASEWTRAKIGYSVKEYGLMLNSVWAVQARLAVGGAEVGPPAVQFEQAAYVWARDVESPKSLDDRTQEKVSAKDKIASLAASKDDQAGKRKSEDTHDAARTRSSARRKT